MTTTATPSPATPALQLLPLAQLRESARNPRRHFDQAKLAELADSIRKSGIITPLIARPVDGGYELAAGHRRFRAAQLAGLTHAPVVVRELDDATFLEVLTVENMQRDDLHPLEEAHGYRTLMESAGYDVAKIAHRVGRSPAYVYDRLRLLALIKPAQELFLANRFTLAHAVILARLAPEHQERAIDTGGASGPGSSKGLFTLDYGLFDRWETEAEDEDPWAHVKPVSVQEFQRWVDESVRFDAAHETVPVLFPETAALVQEAEQTDEKVVHITRCYRVPDEARDGEQRTYGESHWKRADGKEGAKTCERSVVGVVVAGPGRGEAFRVCVDKKKCDVHWAQERREAAKRAKAVATSGAQGADRWELEQQKREEQQRREEAERTRWKKARPALLAAIATALKKASLDVPRAIVLEQLRPDWGFPVARAEELVPAGVTAADALRHGAMRVVGSIANNEWHTAERLKPFAKQLGIDLKKILDEAAPAPKPEKPTAAKKAAAKKAGKSKSAGKKTAARKR